MTMNGVPRGPSDGSTKSTFGAGSPAARAPAKSRRGLAHGRSADEQVPNRVRLDAVGAAQVVGERAFDFDDAEQKQGRLDEVQAATVGFSTCSLERLVGASRNGHGARQQRGASAPRLPRPVNRSPEPVDRLLAEGLPHRSPDRLEVDTDRAEQLTVPPPRFSDVGPGSRQIVSGRR
jgi:hypothetical protein